MASPLHQLPPVQAVWRSPVHSTPDSSCTFPRAGTPNSGQVRRGEVKPVSLLWDFWGAFIIVLMYTAVTPECLRFFPRNISCAKCCSCRV